MSRRFQFSLRALMVALTVACLWLGWKVERARRRQCSIDSIVAAGGVVFYGEGSEGLFWQVPYQGHFWRDFAKIPIRLHMDETLLLDASLGPNIKDAAPVTSADIHYPVDDHELPLFNGFNGGCEVVFWDIRNLSAAAMDKFIQALPGVNVAYHRAPQAGDPGVITIAPPFTRVYPVEGPDGETGHEPPSQLSD